MTPVQLKKELKKDGLTEPQINKILRLLEKFKSKVQVEEDNEEEEVEELIEEPVPKRVGRPKKSASKRIGEVDKGIATTKGNNQGKTGKMPKRNFMQAAGPVQASGINKFDKMPERNQEKADIAIDKKLAKHKPTERRGSSGLEQIECRDCGNEYKVSPVLASYNDEGTSNYICEGCIRAKKNTRGR